MAGMGLPVATDQAVSAEGEESLGQLLGGAARRLAADVVVEVAGGAAVAVDRIPVTTQKTKRGFELLQNLGFG